MLSDGFPKRNQGTSHRIGRKSATTGDCRRLAVFFFVVVTNLPLLAGFAHHFEGRYVEVAVFVVGLFHPGAGGGVFGFFLHVVHGDVGDRALSGYGVTDVVGESNFVAFEIPRAAIVAVQYVRVRATPLGEAAGNGAYLCF